MRVSPCDSYIDALFNEFLDALSEALLIIRIVIEDLLETVLRETRWSLTSLGPYPMVPWRSSLLMLRFTFILWFSMTSS